MLKRGFTLIELLVVVSIISILSAIALPNFSEATTRAKVSRVKSELRTLSEALEIYSLDNNKPMTTVVIGKEPCEVNATYGSSPIFHHLTNEAYASARLKRLTTPIAYMSSVPIDPFANKPAADSADTCVYDSYVYKSAHDEPCCWLVEEDSGQSILGAGYTSGGDWSFTSAGPDRMNYQGGFYVKHGPDYIAGGLDYDPTNGTGSWGDIVRVSSSPGPMSADPDYAPMYDRIKRTQNYPK